MLRLPAPVHWVRVGAFRKANTAFAAGFNRRLASFAGSSGHLAAIEPLGLVEANLPEWTRAEPCEPVS